MEFGKFNKNIWPIVIFVYSINNNKNRRGSTKEQMNKGQFVDKTAEDADIIKALAGRALDSFMAEITSQDS